MVIIFCEERNPTARGQRTPDVKSLTARLLRIFALCAAPALAHDMWIEPATFQAQPGRPVSLRLRVGQDLLGDPLPRDPSLIKQFIVEDAAGRRPVPGRAGGDPAGMVLANQPGVMVAGYRSLHSTTEQDVAKFNDYLKEEGLETLPALRNWKSANGKVSEVFSRCAKSLIAAGAPASDAPADRALGFTLELVAGKNPYAMRPGAEMPVRLTYESKPLAGALVVAINRMNPSAKVSARTDRDGRVSLKLDARGMWLIKAVHIVPAPAGVKAEWESIWASLTFAL